ncbi:hypothetical protein DPMN_014387 [Dreissena polymorpha]|uniref:Uncharacterized protein n=1 Tax=Dreissena polymorpha TaxID=45954 RepID=A0A9D4S3E5_DREPO|nr:hypothetical protein DPMN_014387 [Dreissena polymorpha]
MSLKSIRALTRGSGITEEMQNLWTRSAPDTSGYSSAIQDYTDLFYTLSPQYKDFIEARFKRNAFDLEIMHIHISPCQ